MSSANAARQDVDGASGERVLVVIMNSPRDFAFARDEGWYRIPLKRAPRQLAADYVAFYHTSAFREQRWSIRYYAPVKRFRVASRRDLIPQEASHPRAGELYYKIEIGPLECLPRPIPSAKLRRITFIPTTMERLLHAEDVRDLWEGPPTAQRLWEALQDSGIDAEREFEIREGRVAYHVDLAIFCRAGNLAIECAGGPGVTAEAARELVATALASHGWDLMRFAEGDLERLEQCVGAIRNRITSFGGLASRRELDDAEEY